ncbi:flagellar protein [Rhodopirellula maiorica SM1]|uniref:Flagellar protein n=1 Tax=Rhodopirellula maiorica SM1 TaxID=1265738 RepID=M5RSG4_9BACT|nr:flagellar biosynthetic protein FliO [Rhodopirellula maiorica]EMI22161.1 flagellar protein [Rhodopirellula maiorica SM1]
MIALAALAMTVCATTATAQQYSVADSAASETTSTSVPQTTQPALLNEPTPKVIARGFPALSQRSISTDTAGEQPEGQQESQLAVPGITVASSLAVVLGLFAGFVWLTRRFSTGGSANGVIPKDVVQNLGSTSIDSRTKVSMIRCGNRIIVVAQTATGIHPLSEITDLNEVQQLTASCIGESKRNFASTLREFEKEPAEKGFAGTPIETPPTPRSRGRLFASA